jgi:hypothetical protein
MTLLPPEEPAPRRRRRQFVLLEQLLPHVTKQYGDIDKNKLIVPIDSYQRDESEGKIAREIALHFDPVAFGVLTVIKDIDGILKIADGGTRHAAAMMRTDITDLPCMVYTGMTEEEAAKTFLRINMNRRRLQIDQQQKSELIAREELALAAEKTLQSFRNNRIGFDSLSALRSSLKSTPDATQTIIEMTPKFAIDKHLTSRVFKGLVWLESELRKQEETLNKKSTIRKLQDRFGMLDAFIGGAIPSRTPGDKKTCGSAIARALKIRLPRMDKKEKR